MYIPVTKSCAVRGAGGPEYKRNNATANMLLDMGDDKLQSAIQKQVKFTVLNVLVLDTGTKARLPFTGPSAVTCLGESYTGTSTGTGDGTGACPCRSEIWLDILVTIMLPVN